MKANYEKGTFFWILKLRKKTYFGGDLEESGLTRKLLGIQIDSDFTFD